MKIIVTHHAKNRMTMRGISLEEVRHVIENYERKEYTDFGRINIYGKIGRKKIRVTYKEESGLIIIITIVKITN
ncbi:MAG: DUF4258 domain-containing protein [Candidatus Magasanikbacteria bacterium]|nr:DUF4258 domain-containing protein [Candidatus Magasanikbacteria bacterium]